jgi:hypothetical protein
VTYPELWIFALQILSHEINHGYKLGMLPLETFNSTPVQNLAHLAHLVDNSDDPYLNFGLDGGRFITLDKQQVRGLWNATEAYGCGCRLLYNSARSISQPMTTGDWTWAGSSHWTGSR